MAREFAWIAVDYGKKLKGTTAIACWQNDGLTLIQCPEGQDADRWLLNCTSELEPERIFLDAPLSLPLAYCAPDKADDYFYRQCDKGIGGMSPMFLGALTARAIKCKHTLEQMDVQVIEAYPVGLAQELLADDLPTQKADPKKQKQWQMLADLFPAKLKDEPLNQHQVDALLTWWIGYRYQNNEHRVIGEPDEGLVVI